MDGPKMPPLGGPVDARPHAPPPPPSPTRAPLAIAGAIGVVLGSVIGFSVAMTAFPHFVPRPPPVEPHGGPPGVGRVEIATDPPCQVRIDEAQAGTTPLMISLAPGKHVVTLEGAAQDRFDLDVHAGETTHVLRTYVDKTAAEACDEVSCVLDDYAGACCVKFDKRVHDGLDRRQIQAGVSAVEPQIVACGGRSSAKGKVELDVKVRPDGRVASVLVTETPDAKLGDCVLAAIKQASFAATKNGGSFSYPFLF